MIEIIENIPSATWHDYATRHQETLLSHLPGWSATLALTYALPAYVLLSRTGPSCPVDGILPLLLFCPPGAESRLISLPYTDAAGIIADSPRAQQELLSGALALAESCNAHHLELRQYDHGTSTSLSLATDNDWLCQEFSFKVGLNRIVPRTVGELWDALGSKVRNQVRKAERCGCVVQIGGTELVEPFFAVFSENMRDLGSPTHSRELFANALQQPTLDASIVLVRHEGAPAAGAVVLRHGATLYNPWASSLRRFRPLCPNMLLYWSMLRLAVQSGCRTFDFGRSSPGASTHRFKRQWGARTRRLTWYVFSKKPSVWNPLQETLSDPQWCDLDLDHSRHRGPAKRRWISL
ncbi:MAG: GNAT family N-acetyltransferase [Desulfofustis sp.]|jgi:FemAB-related protein (PEP-CTERM system-associated)|nr:GNAT family N-acetyltransferase [Desulfofustis sp.]